MKLSILLIGLFTGINVWAQRPEESISLINNITTNNDLYNGTVNVNVPLFEIPVGNLILSNNISNTSVGFRPRVDESIYGLHWYANQFGSITREVNKDFLLTKYATIQAQNGVAGIYPNQANELENTTDCIIQKQNLSNGSGSSKKQILQDPINAGVMSGYIPDKFYFDFFGYKGYFIFDNKGNPLVYCENTKLQVISSISLLSKCYSVKNPIDFQNKNISEIQMMDDKGNKFYFGGAYDAVEVNYSQFVFQGNFYNPFLQYNQSFYSGARANYILSWFLKKVELSNGDIIEANYKQGSSDTFNSFIQSALVNNTLFPTNYPTSSQLETANIEVSYSHEISTLTIENYVHTTNMTKRAILQNIEVVGKNININYNYFKDSKSLIHLSNINLNYFGKSENIIFNQTPLGGTNSRYFLTSLNNNGKIYFFEYDKTDNLPSKTSSGTNAFGFWNGTNVQGVGNSNDFFNSTLLKKIIYPSQGYTIFNNEKADFSGGSTTAESCSRLANKLDFDGEKEYRIYYKYKLSNGESSGILDPKILWGTSLNQQIRYSQIQETIINKGTTEYFYSNIISNPDDNSIKKFTASNGSNNLYFKDNDNREYQRGKLLKKKLFDANNNLLRESTYEYEKFLKPESELIDLGANCSTCKISDENYYVLTAIDRSFNENHAATRYEPVIPYLLKKEKVTDYINGKVISSETNIKYRESNKYWHPYPEQIETTTTSGTSIKKILYAHDLYLNACTSCTANENIVGGQYPTYVAMTNANIMFPVIEIVKNKDNKYSLQENLFYAPPFVQKKNRFSKLGTTLDFTNYNITVDKTVDGTSYDLLDNKTNYLQTTDKSGVPTATIYGYKQTSPIAKIVGITYVQLMQILGQPATL